jgi:uncharacterized protein (DUF58 family)
VAALGASFPLRPRTRVVGRAFGNMRASRRGGRSDPVSSRPYHPGDDLRLIDRHASARLSAARGTTELIVREHFAQEAARCVLIVDESPTMRLYPSPWLSKPQVVASAAALIEASAWRARCPWERRDGLAGLPAGSFAFVVSDFLQPPPDTFWLDALERRLDPVPVVVQDPLWEQSFPDAGGVVLPIADAGRRRVRLTRLTRREAADRRRRNEERFAGLLAGFRGLDLEPIVLSSSDGVTLLNAFIAWSDSRRWAA